MRMSRKGSRFVWICLFGVILLEKYNARRTVEEDETEPRCPQHLWECGSGECIARGHRCDGETDCSDSSDELNCPRKPKPLAPGEKRCPENMFECQSGECIPDYRKCDGKKHCIDGSDEKKCPPIDPATGLPEVGPDFKCPMKLFTCNNTECILPKYRCDGEKTCSDGSDEWSCPKLSNATKKKKKTKKPKTEL